MRDRAREEPKGRTLIESGIESLCRKSPSLACTLFGFFNVSWRARRKCYSYSVVSQWDVACLSLRETNAIWFALIEVFEVFHQLLSWRHMLLAPVLNRTSRLMYSRVRNRS